MKDKAGLIFPVCLILFGVYALITSLGAGGEQVELIADHAVPRGLAIVFGLVGAVGGALVLVTALSNKKITA